MTITATATTATTADVYSGSNLIGCIRSDNEGATWTIQIDGARANAFIDMWGDEVEYPTIEAAISAIEAEGI